MERSGAALRPRQCEQAAPRRFLGRVLLLLLCGAGPTASQPTSSPPDRSALYTQGMDYVRQGLYGAAAEVFYQILHRDPRDLEACVGLASALMADGQEKAAIGTCEAGLAVDSTAVPLYHLLAAAYSREGRYEPAIKALEKVIRIHPDYVLGYANLGGIYLKMASWEAAERYLKQALALEPDRPSVHHRLGEVYLYSGRPEVAVEEFRQALRLYGEDATLYFLLGKALEGCGRREEALEALVKAGRLDLSFGEAYYRAGVLARHLGRASQADSAMEVFAHLQQLSQADPKGAIEIKKMRMAIMDSPEEPSYHYRLGLFLAQRGYGDEALNQLGKVLELQPDNFQAMNRMGNILLQQQKLAAALEFYERASILAPAFVPAHMNAAQVCMQLQQPAAALMHYRQAAAAAPEVPLIWYNLALCLLTLKQPAAADSALQVGLATAQPKGDMLRAFEELRARARGGH